MEKLYMNGDFSEEEDPTEDSNGYNEVENEIDLELYELGLDEKTKEIAAKKGEPITFRLLLAIILASIFMFITPLTAQQINLQVYWWAPMIGAFIGAFIGAYVGSILDAFNYKTKINQN